jgi:hypothetical protein
MQIDARRSRDFFEFFFESHRLSTATETQSDGEKITTRKNHV